MICCDPHIQIKTIIVSIISKQIYNYHCSLNEFPNSWSHYVVILLQKTVNKSCTFFKDVILHIHIVAMLTLFITENWKASR
jgi:hypothetical protein